VEKKEEGNERGRLCQGVHVTAGTNDRRRKRGAGVVGEGNGEVGAPLVLLSLLICMHVMPFWCVKGSGTTYAASVDAHAREVSKGIVDDLGIGM
jgi:hypothetical protein